MKWLMVLLTFVLSACSSEQVLESLIAKEELASARKHLTQLQSGQHQALIAALDPSIASQDILPDLVKMTTLLAADKVIASEIVSAQSHHLNAYAETFLSFELEYPQAWFLVHIALRNKAGVLTISGLRVEPENGSLASRHRFNLSGKPVWAYLYLALACLIPLFVGYALIVCLRMDMNRKKWPWVIFILTGFAKLSLNWNSGEMMLQLLAIQLFSASAISANFGPLIIAISLPLGALVFMLKRKQLQAPRYDEATGSDLPGKT